MSEIKEHAVENLDVYGAFQRSDPLFKLFGRSIPVLSSPHSKMERECKKTAEESTITCAVVSPAASHRNPDMTGDTPQIEDGGNAVCIPNELGSSSGSNMGCNEGNPDQESHEGEALVLPDAVEASESDDERRQGENSDSQTIQDKTPKKPDKLLPCPRCDSLDTKFCYYNNYNVNQPRHFCKNCQRYWTAGGTLRNVPVGAGRRKNKHSSSHQRHVLSNNFVVRDDAPDTAHQLLSGSISHTGALDRQLKMTSSAPSVHLIPLDVCSFASLDGPSSPTILNFGQSSPLCESMASTPPNLHQEEAFGGQGMVNGRATGPQDAEVGSLGLNIQIKPVQDQRFDVKNSLLSANEKNHESDVSQSWQQVDESTCVSSVNTQCANRKDAFIIESKVDQVSPCEPTSAIEAAPGWMNGAPFSLLGGPWQYGYNMNWNNVAAPALSSSTAIENKICVNSALSSSGTANENRNGENSASDAASTAVNTCNGASLGIWTGIPWPLMQNAVWNLANWGSAWNIPWGPAATAAAAAGFSTTLGKHPRERTQPGGGKEGSLWVPKTLRIDDPGEAAKSSIWTTLGLGHRPESITSGGIFKTFQPKATSKETDEEPYVQSHCTNPAAMSRSMAFQESG